MAPPEPLIPRIVRACSRRAQHNAALQPALNESFLKSLRILLPGLSLAFAGLVVVQLLGLSWMRPMPVIVLDTGLAVGFFGLALLIFFGFVPARRAHAVGFLTGLAGLSSVLITKISLPETPQSINLAILIVAVGMFVLSTPWLMAFLVVAIYAWLHVLTVVLDFPVAAAAGKVPYPALFAAVVIHAARKKTHRRMELLRLENERQKENLVEALEAAERDLAERRRAEKVLLHKSCFEQLITSISTRFINVKPEHLDEAIESAIESLGRHVGVDRCYVFQFIDNARFVDNTHEWCADGIEPAIHRMRMVPVETFSWYMQRHLNGEVIHLPDVNDLPEEARPEQEEMRAQGIRSLLAVPLIAAGRVIGFVGFDSVRMAKEWTEEEIGLLQKAGEIFAHALEHRRAAAALESSESQYRLLANNIIDVVWTLSERMHATFISPSVEALLGYSADEIVKIDPKAFVPEEDFALIQKFFYDAWKGRANQSQPLAPLEHRLVGKNGRKVWVETRLVCLFAENGKVIGFQGATRDITARKKAELERNKLEDQLLQSQKMEAIGLLAGGIAHDFNNLLTGILGYANILKLDGADDPKIVKAADVIEKAAERASKLTSQLLRFARQDKRENRPVDLHEILDEVTGLLARTINKNIEIVCEPAAANPVVSGDPTQIQQVVLNLAMNARDAMPQGGRLTFRTEAFEVKEGTDAPNLPLAAGTYALLTVSDTGQGIPEEHLGRIFEPFFTTKEQGKGTGMGLATAYGIVKNHNGWITVRTRVGEGTSFQIYLPLQCEVVEFAQPAPQANREQNENGDRRQCILVVDDEDVVRDMASFMLAELGYDVLIAADGQQALEIFHEQHRRIDMVILDMIMPRLSGLECLDALRQIDPDVRAIVSSGYSLDNQIQQMSEAGIRGYVQKPYRMHQLAEVVERTLCDALEQTGS